MKIVINLVLVLLIGLLGYMLYNSIKEPIAFQAQKEMRKATMVKKMSQIRKSQELFKDVTGYFANDFDTLAMVLKNDSIAVETIIGDPDDLANMDKIIRTVTMYSAYDSIKALSINLDSLRYVPYSTTGATFEMKADTMTYQSTLTNVVEVKTVWKEFMGEFAHQRYTKYDNMYDPNALMKFGDLNKPTLSGNWN